MYAKVITLILFQQLRIRYANYATIVARIVVLLEPQPVQVVMPLQLIIEQQLLPLINVFVMLVGTMTDLFYFVHLVIRHAKHVQQD